MIQNDALCEACCRQHGRIFETCNNGCHIRDLFETIMKERDAAVTDLKELGRSEGVPCGNCKHFWEDSPTACKECTVENERINWEWFGLSLEKTSDKEVRT
mgnify:CR=1 FL=1